MQELMDNLDLQNDTSRDLAGFHVFIDIDAAENASVLK